MKKLLAFLLTLTLALSAAGCSSVMQLMATPTPTPTATPIPTPQKIFCSSSTCDNEAVDSTTFGVPYCSKHLAQKKAFAASKEAYGNIQAAYTMIERYASDIQDAWYFGIYQDDNAKYGWISDLSEELTLTEEEVRTGLAYYLVSAFDVNWEEMDEADKETLGSLASEVVLADQVKSFFTLCVDTVNGAYTAKGTSAEIGALLDTAKAQMKALSEEYSDYEHYPALKGYFTTTLAFFEFCENPTGNFEQMKTTMETYMTTARNYKADLSYIFED